MLKKKKYFPATIIKRIDEDNKLEYIILLEYTLIVLKILININLFILIILKLMKKEMNNSLEKVN